VNSFLDGMAERDIPTGVFHFDCFWMKGFEWCDFKFDKDMFPDAKGQIERIKERGMHVSRLTPFWSIPDVIGVLLDQSIYCSGE